MPKLKTMRGFSSDSTLRTAKRVYPKYKNIKVKRGKFIGKSKGGQKIHEYQISGEKR